MILKGGEGGWGVFVETKVVRLKKPQGETARGELLTGGGGGKRETRGGGKVRLGVGLRAKK